MLYRNVFPKCIAIVFVYYQKLYPVSLMLLLPIPDSRVGVVGEGERKGKK